MLLVICYWLLVTCICSTNNQQQTTNNIKSLYGLTLPAAKAAGILGSATRR